MFNYKKRKRGLFTSSTLSEVSPNTLYPYTKIAHATRRSTLLQVHSYFWRFSESENKATLIYLYAFICVYISNKFFVFNNYSKIYKECDLLSPKNKKKDYLIKKCSLLISIMIMNYALFIIHFLQYCFCYYLYIPINN